jgi:hypothetical protein
MGSKRLPILFVTACIVLLGLLSAAQPLFASGKEKVVYSFQRRLSSARGRSQS